MSSLKPMEILNDTTYLDLPQHERNENGKTADWENKVCRLEHPSEIYFVGGSIFNSSSMDLLQFVYQTFIKRQHNCCFLSKNCLNIYD